MPRLPPKARPPTLSDECCSTALLLIDVINAFEFEGAEQLLKRAPPVARALTRLTSRARAANIPVVYVNDNFGRWRSDFHAVVRHCSRSMRSIQTQIASRAHYRLLEFRCQSLERRSQV